MIQWFTLNTHIVPNFIDKYVKILMENNISSMEKLTRKLEKSPKLLETLGFDDEYDNEQIRLALNIADIKILRAPPAPPAANTCGRKRKQIHATVFPPAELQESLASFIVPEGFVRVNKGKCDNSIIWDYGVKVRSASRTPFEKTTHWYCRANEYCVAQNINYKMSTNSTSSASDHLKTHHHILPSKAMIPLQSEYGRESVGEGEVSVGAEDPDQVITLNLS